MKTERAGNDVLELKQVLAHVREALQTAKGGRSVRGEKSLGLGIPQVLLFLKSRPLCLETIHHTAGEKKGKFHRLFHRVAVERR